MVSTLWRSTWGGAVSLGSPLDAPGSMSLVGEDFVDRVSGDIGEDIASCYDDAGTAVTSGPLEPYGTQYSLSYNPLFKSYAPNDCADFVSQSIWAEFGGENTATAINGHYSPMRDNTGGTNWWADASSTDTDYFWTYVPNLIDGAVLKKVSIPCSFPFGVTISDHRRSIV